MKSTEGCINQLFFFLAFDDYKTYSIRIKIMIIHHKMLTLK